MDTRNDTYQNQGVLEGGPSECEREETPSNVEHLLRLTLWVECTKTMRDLRKVQWSTSDSIPIRTLNVKFPNPEVVLMRSSALSRHILKSAVPGARLSLPATISTGSRQHSGQAEGVQNSDFGALRRQRSTEWKRKQGVRS